MHNMWGEIETRNHTMLVWARVLSNFVERSNFQSFVNFGIVKIRSYVCPSVHLTVYPIHSPLIDLSSIGYHLSQWFSTFLMLWPFNTVTTVVTPNITLFWCYMVLSMWLWSWVTCKHLSFAMVLVTSVRGSVSVQRDHDPQTPLS